ncbi:MAG: sulfatase-like hydrolase/transferase, partial [Armatimonadota bacterium]
TLDQIRRRDPTRPIFVWCSHLRPHSPYDPPQFFWDMYIDRELPEIPIGDWAAKHDIPNPGLEITAWHGRLTPEQDHRGRVGYMGCVTHLDYELGRLMDELRRMGVLDNTLIIFTSDHGDMMGDHHLHRKTYAYEGSARIPMLIRYPRGLDMPSGAFEQVVGLQDVMPTILEATGTSIPGSVTGGSMLAAIRGEQWREFFHGEHSPCYTVEEAMQFLTDGREKYIYFPATGEEQFFDLASDRQELHDLAKDPAYAARVATWRQRLIDLLGERADGFSDGEKLLVREERWGPVVGS